MKQTIFALVATTALSVSGAANSAIVDFDSFSEGTVLSMNTDLGGGIFADITAIGGQAQAVVFDTDDGTTSTNNDPDLQSPFKDSVSGASRSFGNALIVQENATGGPDDNGSGGTLIFDFLSDIALGSLFLLDSEIDTSATLYNNGVMVGEFVLDASNESDTGNNENNNEFTSLDFLGLVGDRLEVEFSRSGALGEFHAQVVPLPATLPMLAFGLMGAGYVMRRRKS